MHNLETDGSGNVITNPVTGWTITTAAGIAVIAAIQYAESQDQLESGNSNSIQLILTPTQCLELAGTLTKAAKALLNPVPPGTSLQ